MNQQAQSSAVLPIAHVVLRILVVLNWLTCALVLALLLIAPNREWIISALDLSPSLEADRVIFGLRAIAVIGLATVPLHWSVLKRLLAMIETVRRGDPFVAENAQRLQTIAWILVTLQLVGLVIAAIAKTISTRAHPVDLDAGFSVNGWLAVILTFVLARVFAEGARMRDDLEGTV